MIEELSDRELVLMIRHGNEQAFDVIYRRYHRAMYLYSLRLLKDKDVAADIVQGVFVKLWEYSEMLPHDLNIRSYLHSMVRNRVVNYIRDNRARLIHNYMIVQENGLVDDIDFLRRIEDKAQQEELKKAIESLPPQQKNVIKFRFEGKTKREIAANKKVSHTAINDCYDGALKRLRKFFSQYPEFLTYFPGLKNR